MILKAIAAAALSAVMSSDSFAAGAPVKAIRVPGYGRAWTSAPVRQVILNGPLIGPRARIGAAPWLLSPAPQVLQAPGLPSQAAPAEPLTLAPASPEAGPLTMERLSRDPSISAILEEGAEGDVTRLSAAAGRLADGAKKPAPEPVALRPASERWIIGGRSYDSTSELLSAAKKGEVSSGAPALHWSRALSALPPTGRDHAQAAAAGGLMAGTIGAFLGAVLGAFLVVVSGLSELMTLALYGHPTPAGPALGLAPIGIGYAIAAAAGAVAAYRESRADAGFTGSRRGSIERVDGRWRFKPEGESQAVDLAAHRDAPAYKPPKAKSRWFDAPLGAAYAAAMGVAAFFVPLGPVLLGAWTSFTLAPGQDSGLAGALLGGVYGYGLAGLFYALGLAAGFWPALAAAAALGALAGVLALPRLRRERRIAEELAGLAPWWSR